MGKVRALKNVKSVELVGLPRLTKCVLLTAFRAVKEMKMKNAGKLEENEGSCTTTGINAASF